MIAALLLGVALAADPGMGVEPLNAPPSPAQVEELTQEIADGLRCPVCQGISVGASSSDAAVAMKNRIEELVAQGYSRGQIEDYFVDRYGTWLLLEPEVEGVNWLIWAGPFVLLISGLLIWVFRARDEEEPAPDDERPVMDEYAQRILDELEGD